MGEVQAKPHLQSNPAAKIPHPRSGVFAHKETGTVHLSFFTLCPKMKKCQKCTRALATRDTVSTPTVYFLYGAEGQGEAHCPESQEKCVGSCCAVWWPWVRGEALPSLGPSFLICKVGVLMPGLASHRVSHQQMA